MKQKKKSDVAALLDYAGSHRGLTFLGLALSAAAMLLCSTSRATASAIRCRTMWKAAFMRSATLWKHWDADLSWIRWTRTRDPLPCA